MRDVRCEIWDCGFRIEKQGVRRQGSGVRTQESEFRRKAMKIKFL
jgi:hypothetical protein